MNTYQNQTISAKNAVLNNEDMLRSIAKYVRPLLPFILSFKTVQSALSPLDAEPGDKWIKSRKIYYVTTITMIEWAQSQGCVFNLTSPYINIFLYAASNGSLEALQWAHQQYPSKEYPAAIRDDVFNEAAKNGHLPILEYLSTVNTSYSCDEFTVGAAAKAGHLHVLKWFKDKYPDHSRPCWYVRISDGAALSGHFHIIKWLKEIGVPPPWDPKTCAYSAGGGHLEILRWLRMLEPPCPWNHETCFAAVLKGRMDVLEWLRAQEPPCPWDKLECLELARVRGNEELEQWILRQPE